MLCRQCSTFSGSCFPGRNQKTYRETCKSIIAFPRDPHSDKTAGSSPRQFRQSPHLPDVRQGKLLSSSSGQSMSAGHCVTGNGAFSIPDRSAANGKCPSISVKIYCPGIRHRKASGAGASCCDAWQPVSLPLLRSDHTGPIR